ncbi:hypothetical protein [Herbidospora yilanensis]|uniref:hypothetical protein n=1 Tax=Herbidospora yilanensis TaxID=354426 RepID=UPI0007C6711C|nr:hypothetical protein [Herbidospora yilanensis]
MTTPLQTAAEMGGRRALALALMALIFTLFVPTMGLALSVFGLIVGVRDLRTLKKGGQPTGMATGAVVISTLAFLLGGVSTAVQVYLGTELTAYTECLKGAGTVTAQTECSTQLKTALEAKLGMPWPANMPLPG